MPAWPSERSEIMNETEIRKYATLMRELDLTGLEITEDNKVVRLERTYKEAEPSRSAVQNVSMPEMLAPAPQAPEGVCITSPMVGVFYAAAAENAAPYVRKGDHVKKGQTLCIVEAMKMLNEITAEEDCTISDICVTNGQVVEFGTELFRVRR